MGQPSCLKLFALLCTVCLASARRVLLESPALDIQSDSSRCLDGKKPKYSTVMEMLETRRDVSVFLELVKLSQAVDLVAYLSNPNLTATVFVFTDTSIKQQLKRRGQTVAQFAEQDGGILVDRILRNHIVQMALQRQFLALAASSTVSTWVFDPIKIVGRKNKVVDAQGNAAKILKWDITAACSYIHVIDQPLVPTLPDPLPPPTIASALATRPELSICSQIVTQAASFFPGLDGFHDTDRGYTVFAATDDAFSKAYDTYFSMMSENQAMGLAAALLPISVIGFPMDQTLLVGMGQLRTLAKNIADQPVAFKNETGVYIKTGLTTSQIISTIEVRGASLSSYVYILDLPIIPEDYMSALAKKK